MRKTRGFTLIELMVVVAIIAILASLAITAYSKSISKAQLSEAFTGAEGLKNDVLAYQHQKGICPTIGMAGSGLASNPASYAGRYVASATVRTQGGNCVVTITMRSNTVSIPLRRKQVVFTSANTSEGAARWTCSSDVAAEYLPQTCR